MQYVNEVIRGVGAILRDALREHDTAGRYGGEEFGILLAEADAGHGQAIAERIRKRIGATAFGPGGSLRCTASARLQRDRPGRPAVGAARVQRGGGGGGVPGGGGGGVE